MNSFSLQKDKSNWEIKEALITEDWCLSIRFHTVYNTEYHKIVSFHVQHKPSAKAVEKAIEANQEKIEQLIEQYETLRNNINKLWWSIGFDIDVMEHIFMDNMLRFIIEEGRNIDEYGELKDGS